MPFHHTAGTIAGIAAWFAIFEAWVRLIGWTVETGAGTTDIVLRSLGEVGDKTMLFVRVWDVGANTVRMEVRDDAVGTHVTTLGGGLNSGGVDIVYRMSADLDAIVIVWEQPASWYLRYAGLVMPFSMNPPDETYYMLSMDRIPGANSAVLRRFDHAWDQNDTPYCNEWITEAIIDRDDGSFPIGGLYFGDRADVAGQFKHISCRIQDVVVVPPDTITTHQESGTTDWEVVRDENTFRFALRTGGIEPTGDPEDRGHFGHVMAIAYTPAQFFDAIVAFMIARGWTATDISGASGRDFDWEFNSTGESRLEDIWIRTSWSGAPRNFVLNTADSAFGTVGRHETTDAWAEFWNEWMFPTHVYLSGDRDCLVITLQDQVYCFPMYAGHVIPTAPNLSSTYMKAVSFDRLAEMRILEDHLGLWDQPIQYQRGGDDLHCVLSSPNNYDGLTSIFWPFNMCQPFGLGMENVGQVKYMYAHEGDALQNFDTFRVGDHLFRHFSSLGPILRWAMRIA